MAGIKAFYTASFAPNPQLVDLVIRVKGLDIPVENVDILGMANRSPEMLAKNPAGQLPFFELENGACIADTLAMCEYLEEKAPEPPVFGTTAEQRADTRMWQRRLEEHIIYPTFNAFRFWTASDDCEGDFKDFFKARAPVLIPEAWKGMREWAANRLKWLEEQKKDSPSEYVCGDSITVVDCQLYTCLKFFAIPGFGDYLTDNKDELPWCCAFMETMKARPEVQASEAAIAAGQ